MEVEVLELCHYNVSVIIMMHISGWSLSPKHKLSSKTIIRCIELQFLEDLLEQ